MYTLVSMTNMILLLFLFQGNPNDCAANPNACEHICHTHNDSYYCTCYSGYRLASNGRTCDGELITFINAFSFIY